MLKHDRTTTVGLAAVAVSAAVLTFTTLRALAVACGFGDWLSWLLPVAVDAAGLVALRIWLQQGTPLAKRLSMACVGLSVAGNATQHGLAAYVLPVPWWVIVIVSAVPPAMLAAVVHLAHQVARTDSGTGGEDGAGPDHGADRTPDQFVETADPVRVVTVPNEPRVEADTPDRPDALPASGTAHGPVWTEETVREMAVEDGLVPADREADEHLDDLVRWAAEEGSPSRNAIMRRYKVGTGRADKLLGQLARTPV